jgi:hypothetical protein
MGRLRTHASTVTSMSDPSAGKPPKGSASEAGASSSGTQRKSGKSSGGSIFSRALSAMTPRKQGDDDEDADAATAGGTQSDIYASVGSSLSGKDGKHKKSGGFDAGEAQAELCWLAAEEKLVVDCARRLEGCLLSVFQQHLERANAEAEKMAELQSSLQRIVTIREDERRAETELLQIRYEVASNAYHSTNRTALEHIARINGGSHPRFGRPRPFTEYRSPADLTPWDAAARQRRQQK